MKNLLFIGDAACGSGFGQATHHILKHMGDRYKISVLGVNYRDDPHSEPYRIYTAYLPGGDVLGIGRLKTLIPEIKPDLVVVQSNPWHMPLYRKYIPEGIPVVGIVAVEGKNCIGRDLNGLNGAIFWTEFGRHEAEIGGMVVPSAVVPLGVDLDVFKPGDRRTARRFLGLPPQCEDAFIVINCNRNQHRKRMDLSIAYFAEWVKARDLSNVYLYLHAVNGSGVQLNIDQLVKYHLGTERRDRGVILAQPKDLFKGAPIEYVVAAYQAADIGLTTTLGEGWGLTTMEMMACRIPVVAPDYAALGEWARGAAYLVPCVSEGVMPDVNTMIGSIPSKEATIKALDDMYEWSDTREWYAGAGRACVRQDQYRWPAIAQRFAEEIERLAW